MKTVSARFFCFINDLVLALFTILFRNHVIFKKLFLFSAAWNQETFDFSNESCHLGSSSVVSWQVVFLSKWDLHQWPSGLSQDCHHVIIRVISFTCHHSSHPSHQQISIMGWSKQVAYHSSYCILDICWKHRTQDRQAVLRPL